MITTNNHLSLNISLLSCLIYELMIILELHLFLQLLFRRLYIIIELPLLLFLHGHYALMPLNLDKRLLYLGLNLSLFAEVLLIGPHNPPVILDLGIIRFHAIMLLWEVFQMISAMHAVDIMYFMSFHFLVIVIFKILCIHFLTVVLCILIHCCFYIIIH